jgi:hypothetical protein
MLLFLQVSVFEKTIDRMWILVIAINPLISVCTLGKHVDSLHSLFNLSVFSLYSTLLYSTLLHCTAVQCVVL